MNTAYKIGCNLNSRNDMFYVFKKDLKVQST